MGYPLRCVLTLALLVQDSAVVPAAQGEKLSPGPADSQSASPAPFEAENPGVPVVIDGRPIIYIPASLGGLNKEARADGIQGSSALGGGRPAHSQRREARQVLRRRSSRPARKTGIL